VHLTTDPRLERHYLIAQLRLVRRGYPKHQRGAEERAGEQVKDQVDDRAGVEVGPLAELAAQLRAALLGHVLERGHEQRLAGREVVLRGAPRYAGVLGDD